MKKQTHRKGLKKITALLLLICFLIAFFPANVFAVNTYVINGVSVQYTDFSSSTNECWAYANNVYNKIWGQKFSSSFGTSDNMLRNLTDSELTMTREHIINYISAAALGSSIRYCNSEYLHAADNWGHNQILVAKSSSGFTIFHGGLSSGDHRAEVTYTWDSFMSSYYAKTYAYIKYIKWPGAPAYGSSQTDDLTLTGYTYPTTLTQGSSFTLKGIITSGKTPINMLTIAVFDMDGKFVIGREGYTVNTMSYNIKDIDSEIKFGTLSPGDYQYVVWAKNGSTDEILLYTVFTVTAAASDTLTLSGYTAPTHLDVGKMFGIKGTITSGSSNITKVTAAVYDTSGNFKTGKENVTVNSKTYSLSNVNPYIVFNNLPQGTYRYKVIASNSTYSDKLLLDQEFTVGDPTTYYTLDVNGSLDGTYTGNTSGYGTFDVYINGSLAEQGVSDYYNDRLPSGSTYEIRNVNAESGHNYNGVVTGSSSGTLSDSTTVVLSFSTLCKLDVNFWLDGNYNAVYCGDYGSFDVYINGVLDADDVHDYCREDILYGSSYEIKDIKTVEGKVFNGAASGNLSGWFAGNVWVELSFVTGDYTNRIDLWAYGFENREGDNEQQSARRLGDSYFSKKYGETYQITADLNTVPVPNGFFLWSIFGAWDFDDAYKYYDFGYTATQPDYPYAMEYICTPTDYSITYDLDGGTNSANNPSKYNVLYGVTFEAPTREGYTFTGWTDSNGNAITGINPGANATHSSAEELYSMLEGRTTGDKTIYANWVITPPSEPTVRVYSGTNLTKTVIYWNECTKATHYDVRIYHEDGTLHDAAYELTDLYWQLSVPAGNYYVTVASVDANYDECYTFSDRVDFSVIDVKYLSVLNKAEYNGHTYIRLDLTTPDWREAKTICESLGGHMVTITSQEENDAVLGISGGKSLWLGATDEEEEGVWKWVNGEEFTYTNWSEEEPNNGHGIEHYIEFYGDLNGTWNDNRIVASYSRFIVVEFDAAGADLADLFTPAAEIEYNDHAYTLYNGAVSNWHDAKAICEKLGGYLVTITSEEENAVVLSLFNENIDSGLLYLGASDGETEGTWKWVTGEEFEYSNWDPTSPDNSQGTEHYAQMYSWNGMWNDIPDDRYLCYFIVEKSLYQTDEISLYIGGFGDYVRFAGTTYFKEKVGEEFLITADYVKTPLPNGYHLANSFGTGEFDEYANFFFGDVPFVQMDKGMFFETFCYPTDYTITYDLDGGVNSSNNPSKYNVLYGVTFEVPTKDGAIFLGWTDANGNAIIGVNPGADAEHGSAEELYEILKDRTTGDVTVYANWAPITYSVKFDANGGTNAPAKQTKIHGEALTLRSDVPAREGYTFKGWATAKDAAAAEYMPGGGLEIDANTVLYAVWSENSTAIVKGDANGDGEIDSLDASSALKYDAGMSELSAEQFAAADVNGDGEVDSLDATLILKYDAGIIDEL